MADNEAFSLHAQQRSECETKMERVNTRLESKVSDKTFWTVFGLVVTLTIAGFGCLFSWLMNMNEKVTRVETKVEMIQDKSPLQKLEDKSSQRR